MRGAEILRLDVEPYDCQQIRDRLPAICSVVKRERYCSDERLVEMIDYVSNIAKNYGIYIREFMSPELRPQTFAEGILAEQAASLRKSLQSISQP